MARWLRYASLFLLLLLAATCLAGFKASVKLIDRNKIVIVNNAFYKGPGESSLWTSRDSYEVDGGRLVNISRNQTISLQSVPTIKIQKVFKEDRLISDEYIILLSDHRFYFIKSDRGIKTGYSQRFFIDGKYLYDLEGNEFELKELNSWECFN